MAGRPRKQTVDYFPHFTTHKRTMDIIERRFGVHGYAFWFKLLEVLGSTEGHCFDINDADNWEYLTARAYVDDDTGRAILDKLSALNAIDKELYKEGRIWSQNFVDNLTPLYGKRVEDMPVKPTLCDIRKRLNRAISDTGNTPIGGISDTGNSISDTGKEQRIGKDRIGKDKNIYGLRPGWISEQLFSDLLENRKFKKLQNTPRAINTFLNSLQKGLDEGYAAEEMINEYISSRWTRFDHSWMKKNKGTQYADQGNDVKRTAAADLIQKKINETSNAGTDSGCGQGMGGQVQPTENSRGNSFVGGIVPRGHVIPGRFGNGV